MDLMFIAALFIIARSLKQPKCPSQMYKEDVVLTMEHYSAIKKE